MKTKTLVKNLKKKEYKNANIIISLGEGHTLVADRIIHKDKGLIFISTK